MVYQVNESETESASSSALKYGIWMENAPHELRSIGNKDTQEDILGLVLKLLQCLREQKEIAIVQVKSKYLWLTEDTSALSANNEDILPGLSGGIKVRNQDELQTVLSLLKYIKKYQPVVLDELRMEYMTPDTSEAQLKLEVVELNKNITCLRISDCVFPASIWEHLVQQLHGCDKLEQLDLRDTKTVPIRIYQLLSTMTSLKDVNMFECNMTSDVSHVVMSGLSQCRHLEDVDLSENTLTGCIGDSWGQLQMLDFMV